MEVKLWNELNDQQSEELSGGETNNYRSTSNIKSGKLVVHESSNGNQNVANQGWADFSYSDPSSAYALGTPGNGKSPVFKFASTSTSDIIPN